MRPAADGIYPGREGGQARPPRPVLADVASYGPPPEPGHRGRTEAGRYTYPGRPTYRPWPYAVPGQGFVPPADRGRPAWPAWPTWPQEEHPHLVNWLPIRAGLKVHGLRHGHQT